MAENNVKNSIIYLSFILYTFFHKTLTYFYFKYNAVYTISSEAHIINSHSMIQVSS